MLELEDRLESLLVAIIDRIADRIAEKLKPKIEPGEGEPSDSAGPHRLLWREDEAAKALGISRAWLKSMRIRGYIRASTNVKPILYDAERMEEAKAFLLKHGNKAS